jgi:translation elongation factor EF-Tu-like GTPase
MGRKAGVPNKITAEIKERLATILNEAMDSIDVKTLTVSERLKLIQISVQYVIPRLKQVDNVDEEMPTNFQIEIIDRLDKYKDRDLDKAIRK